MNTKENVSDDDKNEERKKFLEKIRISVIIPTRNREDQLKRCLAALQKQSRTPDQIIIISESNKRENINPESGIQYIYVKELIGPSALRNIGIKHSTGYVIVFLDDDSVPRLNFIENIVVPFSDQEIGILRGKAESTISISNIFAAHYDLGDKFVTISPRRLLLCCMALRKDILDKINGFDESIRYGHEEADLGYRAAVLGYKCFYTPEAVVFHNYVNSSMGYLKKRFKWGQRRHQLKKHGVKMINRKRILLNLLPFLAFIILMVSYLHRHYELFYTCTFVSLLFAPFMYWFSNGLRKFKSLAPALIFGFGEISGDLGLLAGYFMKKDEAR